MKLISKISERLIGFFSYNNYIVIELFIILFITFFLIKAGL